MTKMEEVLRGLECCAGMSGDECQKYPYEYECRDTELPPYGIPHLAADALALLRKQEKQIKKYELERSWDENPDTMGKW